MTIRAEQRLTTDRRPSPTAALTLDGWHGTPGARRQSRILRLRSATPADVQAAGEICYGAFKAMAERHGFVPDFPTPQSAIGLMDHMLARSDIHAIVAEIDGRVVGSNFLWAADEVAGIGPITVDTAAQNRSIGRRLMEAVLHHAAREGIAAVRLVQAAYHGRSMSLYTKLGFSSREPLIVMQGHPLRQTIPDRFVRPAVDAYLDDANLLCRRIHGFDRGEELRLAIREGSATVVTHQGRITGYATGIGFFGHAVGESAEDLKALIAAAPAFTGPGFMLPIRNGELFGWCLRQGLRVVQPMTLMTRGFYQEPRGPFLPSILY